MNKEQQLPGLRLMVLITGNKEAKEAVEIMNEIRLPIHYVCKGEGTATSEILDYLGIGTAEKAVMFSVVPKLHVRELFGILERELKLNRYGKGIVFTVPISGASLFLTRLMDDEHKQQIMDQMERNVNQMTNSITHSLLMVTINQGYSDELMAAAKGAGAMGGTVLHARRVGSDEPLKRWGISIQEEKEIVFILTTKDKKKEIMKAICDNCGLNTEMQGMVTAIPVDAVAGLRDADDFAEA